jgi:hypothetical protein
MRAFVMHRNDDVTGVSGTGLIAEGVEFSDGRVALRWLTEQGSTVVWDNIQAAIDIHGHDGKTQFVFSEELRQ